MSSHNHVKICNQITLIAGPLWGPELCALGRTVCRVRNMVLYQGICLHSPTWPFPDSITKNPPLCPSKIVPVTSTSQRCYQHQLRCCFWSANSAWN